MKTLFVVGDSGAGKSSFINKVSRRKVAQVGDPMGEAVSVTQQAQFYEVGMNFILIDTKGTNDTDDDNNDNILQGMLEIFLVKNQPINQANGVIYLHPSTQSERLHFGLRMKKLERILGQQLVNQAVVICSKYNEITQKQQKIFEEKIIKHSLKAKNIKYVKWDSGDDQDESEVEGQMENLQQIISEFPLVDIEIVKKIDEGGLQEAEILRKNDLIPASVVDSVRKTGSCQYDVKHVEAVSRWAIWGDTKQISDTQNWRYDPPFPNASFSRRITNVSVYLAGNHGALLDYEYRSDGLYCQTLTFTSKIYFPKSVSGQCYQAYRIDVDYEYYTSEEVVKQVPRYQTCERYIDLGKRIFVMKMFDEGKEKEKQKLMLQHGIDKTSSLLKR